MSRQEEIAREQAAREARAGMKGGASNGCPAKPRCGVCRVAIAVIVLIAIAALCGWLFFWSGGAA